MHASPSTTTSTHRARWAAIGAAVAVSLGAGGLGIANAVTPDGATAYVPITPCRLVDTRPGDAQVGAQVGPVAADTAITVLGRGAVAGTCAGVVPDTATGLQLNVTAVDATQATFLTLYPEGAERPTASNVNVSGPAATPNAAAVTLNAANGQFHVFNRFGTTNVVIDIAGFYTEHQHTGDDIVDGSLTGADIEDGSLTGAHVADGSLTGADVANNSINHTKTSNEAGIAYNAVSFNPSKQLSAADEFIVRTRINVPSDGYVVANAELQWSNGSAGLDRGRCQLTKGATQSISTSQPYLRLTDGGDTGSGLFYSDSTHRVFEVKDADDTGTILTGFGQYINLVCDETEGDVRIVYATLTLEFYPTEYTPQGLILIPFPLAVED
ncbi:MAG TPA: hypothetical protein VNQ73_21965 [Ilumatobacter sp.]|nr:hypothetical protein [Ilumatobacter sp.]